VVVTREIKVSTKGHTDIVNITSQLKEAVGSSRLTSGIVCLFVPGTTATLTTMEYEPGLIKDVRLYWEKVAGSRDEYEHNVRWGDGNGYAHVRSAFSGPSLVIPIIEGKPVLGTWQEVVFIDFDNRARSRTIFVQIVGE